MSHPIVVGGATVQGIVEQEAPFFDPLEFFPKLTRATLEENREWLEPRFIDPATGKLILCIQSYLVRTPHHNILIDSCVGNDKPRPRRPFWDMMKGAAYERGLQATGLTFADIDFVMCTHLHVDHVGWNTRLQDGRWVPDLSRRHATCSPIANSPTGRNGRSRTPTRFPGSATRCFRSCRRAAATSSPAIMW
jgi:glyoxylase-like metal-dependent hydrolase (beta-lactamase superfamily II)